MKQTFTKFKSGWKTKCKFYVSAILTLLLAFSTMSAFAESEKNLDYEPYAVSDGGTLTFYYNANKPADAMDFSTGYFPWMWNSTITKVKIDDSFKNYKPTSCAKLFYGLMYLTEIEGLENLNTEDVTDMSNMFYLCLNLKTLDLSGFDTRKVTNFGQMFSICTRLTTIYTGNNFVVGRSTLTTEMFSVCSSILGSQGTVYDNDIQDGTYAKIDGGETAKGYFSAKGVTPPEVESIAIKTLPKTTYSLTEALSSIDGVVSVKFSGRSAQDIDLGICTISSSYDSTTVGSYTVTATYRGKSTTYTVAVEDRDDAYFTTDVNTLYAYYGKYKSGAWLLSQANSSYKESVQKIVIDPSFSNYTPTNFSNMFAYYYNVLTIEGLENLNLSSVTSMESLFSGDNSLTTLDLSSFDTKNVVNMVSMFSSCSSLKTIYVGSKWSTASVTESNSMFYNCTAIVGGKGTKFNSEKIDATYARVDGEASAQGYFTSVNPYAVSEGGTLTFYYNANKPADAMDFSTGYFPWMWNSTITKVKIDDSFKNYKPTSCAKLFYGLMYLTEIEGLENLNTEDVTDMSNMFYLCLNLKTLDLSGFDTRKVTNFGQMFSICTRLTTIYTGNNFVVGRSTLTTEMFSVCSSILGSQGTVYDNDIQDGTYAKIDGGETAKGYFSAKGVTPPEVESIAIKTLPKTTYSLTEALSSIDGVVSVKFSGRSAQDIDLGICTISSSYDSTTVGSYTVTATYRGKSTTYTVAVEDRDDAYFTTDVNTLYAYYGKYKSGAWLLSQANSSYKESVQKIVIDPSFSNYTPTNFSNMFAYYYNVLTIEGLENLNLSSVTSMESLFSGDNSLTTLDLSSFDTKNVVNMVSMFSSCSSLKTIYVGSKWSTASVTESNSMFYNCTAIVGGKGTKFNSEKTDATFARVDGGTSAQGYFSTTEPIIPVSLRTLPSTMKKSYQVGDPFECDGGLLAVTYSNNSIDTVSLCNAQISEVFTDRIGPQRVLISYLGLTTYVTIVVSKSPKPTNYTPPVENGVYQLSTAEDLFWFITQVNNGNNKLNVALTQDIVVNQNCLNRITSLSKSGTSEEALIAWQPIGTSDYPFEGSFNGHGHSVSGLYLNDKEQDNVGLFGVISEEAVVKNVGLEDSYIQGNENVGSICGNNQGTIANCYNTSIVTGNQNVGAISGSVTEEAVVVNSYSVGKATTTAGEEKGISGVVSENVKNCYYLTEKTDNTDEQAKTAAEFKSGEVLKALVEGAKVLAEESNNNEKFVLEVFDLDTELPGVDEIEEPTNPDNPSTSVVEVSSNSVRIWSFDKTVFVENADSEIHIITLSGTTVCRLVPESSRIEINLSKAGIYVVKCGKISQKVAIQ